MIETIHKSALVDLVAFADPASGETSRPGCQMAIVVVGQHPEGMAFVLDEWADRTSVDVLDNKIFEIHKKWRTRRFGIESSAQQNLWAQELITVANARRERIVLVPVDQPTNQTKEWRITTTITHWMHNGMLYVAEGCVQLLHQLRVYPGGTGPIDLVDALASALRMLRDPLVRMRTAPVEHLR